MNLIEGQLSTYHWLFAVIFALLVHSLFLFTFQADNKVVNESSSHLDHKEIVISLKKIVQPVIPEPKIKQEITPPIKVKEKKLKPVKPKKAKPKVVAPKVHKPQVSPLSENFQKEIKKTPVTSKPSTKQTKVTSKQSNPDSELKILRQSYYQKLAEWLERHKKYPGIARRRHFEGTVQLRFTLNQQGTLLQHEVLSPSKHRSLNQAAIKMLERASPMPPIPKEIQGNETKFVFTIPVHFKLSN